MLTGLYPHQHGITGNDPLRGKDRQEWISRFGQCPQLPALLGELGYLSLIKWPGKVRPQRDETHLASNIDLVPTLLAACGLKPAPEMPGINLLDREAVSKRKTIFAENFTHDMVNPKRPADSLCARSCINREWKLTVWQDPMPGIPLAVWRTPPPQEKVELYHLESDPSETHNLSGKHTERVAAMRKELDDWWNP